MVALRKPTPIQSKARARRKSRPLVKLQPNYWEMVIDFERDRRARRRSDRTLITYREAFKDFAAYLEREKVSLHIEAVQRAHIESYMIEMMSARKCRPATASTRYSVLHAFFAWLAEEDEIDASPMSRMHRPNVPLEPPVVASDEHIAQLLSACEGRDFRARRDRAIIRMLMDCGCRRGELCGMRLEDVDQTERLARITGKTGTRTVPYGSKTADALAAYLRVRRNEDTADLSALWLSQYGALHPASINGIINRRARQAGIARHLWPHLFRHTFAHDWLSHEGSEGDLMELAGWSGVTMVRRYGRSAAHSRAIEAARRKKRGDRV